MPIIQLTPQLHDAVHKLTRVNSREDASPFLNELSLSKKESAAVFKTFYSTLDTRKKGPSEPRSKWD